MVLRRYLMDLKFATSAARDEPSSTSLHSTASSTPSTLSSRLSSPPFVAPSLPSADFTLISLVQGIWRHRSRDHQLPNLCNLLQHDRHHLLRHRRRLRPRNSARSDAGRVRPSLPYPLSGKEADRAAGTRRRSRSSSVAYDATARGCEPRLPVRCGKL